MALRKVKLYGKLGKLFGTEWELDVWSVAEAIRAIDMNVGGALRNYLSGDGKEKKYKIAVKKKKNLIEREEINAPFGDGTIYIMPTLKGADEIGQIIVGIILVIAAFYTAGWSLKGLAALKGWGAVALNMGAALILGGVTQLLAPNPSIDASSEEDQRVSTSFQGNASTIYQGGSVGIVYGRALVAPMPIMLSFNVNDTQTTSSTYQGGVESSYLPGGGTEYIPIESS